MNPSSQYCVHASIALGNAVLELLTASRRAPHHSFDEQNDVGGESINPTHASLSNNPPRVPSFSARRRNPVSTSKAFVAHLWLGLYSVRTDCTGNPRRDATHFTTPVLVGEGRAAGILLQQSTTPYSQHITKYSYNHIHWYNTEYACSSLSSLVGLMTSSNSKPTHTLPLRARKAPEEL